MNLIAFPGTPGLAAGDTGTLYRLHSSGLIIAARDSFRLSNFPSGPFSRSYFHAFCNSPKDSMPSPPQQYRAVAALAGVVIPRICRRWHCGPPCQNSIVGTRQHVGLVPTFRRLELSLLRARSFARFNGRRPRYCPVVLSSGVRACD